MGFQGTFWFVEHDDVDDVAAALRGATTDRGMPLVARSPLSAEEWNVDRRGLGFAIASHDGWVAIAASDGRCDGELAAALAASLHVPVVVSTVADICEPAEPEHLSVFGADPDDPRFLGLYQRFPADYRALAARSDAVCFVVRALETRGHVDAWKVEASSLDDDDLAF
ncbi:MAG: hypothetical protein H6721_33030 [Sandaracinus sp.]|nr:hypothetical protein [Sandaracinus sp.]MCB9624306.1 hypothetical protein [Sandaracinus sp.]MCB9636957.1 hypothetical protein [Sandaracinus sp.]